MAGLFKGPRDQVPAGGSSLFKGPRPAPPTAAPEIGWADVPGQAAENFLPSAGKFVGDIYSAVSNPIETVGNLGDLGAGTLREGARYLLPESAFNAIDSLGNQEAADRASNTASAVGNFYADRYGSAEGWKDAIATDPVGVMSDLSLPLTGAGGLAAKAPGLVGKVGRVAQVAGDMMDPINAAGKAINRAGKTVSAVDNALTVRRSTPTNIALSEVGQLGDKVFKPYNAMSMDRAIAELGPDAVRADVLREDGLSSVRRQANLNPEARGVIKDFAYTRQDGQNVRLAQDLQTQADLPPGSRLSVDDLREAAAGASRPPIDQAYQAARTAGNEIDFNLFDNIITTEVSAPVFQQAIRNVSSRAARNPAAGGNLAVLDETRRLLSGMAEQGYASRDPMASVYGETARALTQRLDEVLQGDVYAEARMLREQAHRADDAFVLGEELGQRNVPIDAPTRAGDVAREHTPNMAAAYAQTKVGQLINNNDTAAALSGFKTDQGRQAYMSGLGSENGGNFGRSVGRESTYRRLPEALGNSTTASQMIEAGGQGALGMGRDAGFGALLTGFDPFTALSIAGATALARKYGGKFLDNMVQERNRAAAPIAAHALVDKGALPSFEPLQQSRVGGIADTVAGFDLRVASKPAWAARQAGIVNNLSSQFGGPR